MAKVSLNVLGIACAGLLFTLASTGKWPTKASQDRMKILEQTYIAVEPRSFVHLPPLIAADGSVVAQDRFQGHWSVIFFGFTACPLVCPKTLAILSAFSRNSESRVPSGGVHPIFVSVDPEHDTPVAIARYLEHFDPHILGVTGSREAIARFSHEVGASYRSVGSGIDHSTSLFVLDPDGYLAGILLRPNNPADIIADLAALRHSHSGALPSR